MNLFFKLKEYCDIVTSWLVFKAIDINNGIEFFWWIGDIVNYLSGFTSKLGGFFWDAGHWYDSVEERLQAAFSWDTIRSLIEATWPALNSLITWFYSWTDRVRDVINEWWMSTMGHVDNVVDNALTGIRTLIDDITGTLYYYVGQWQQFQSTTLRTLLSVQFWQSFWGGTFGSISEWWAVQINVVTELIETNIAPMRDVVNQHTTWLEPVKEFITDPEEFILKLLARLW